MTLYILLGHSKENREWEYLNEMHSSQPESVVKDHIVEDNYQGLDELLEDYRDIRIIPVQDDPYGNPHWFVQEDLKMD